VTWYDRLSDNGWQWKSSLKRQDAALLGDEMRIKDARMATIAPHRRPYYPPAERMAILKLRAARGWSLPQTAGPNSASSDMTIMSAPITIRGA
jgi:hypothetical protein